MKTPSSPRVVTTAKQKIVLVIAGFLFCLFLLEAGLRMGGFFLTATQDLKNSKALRGDPAYRILCLGESTTARSYPPVLERILNQTEQKRRFSVIDKGLVGTSTSWILDHVQDSIKTYQPQIAVIMMGVNDKFCFNAHSSEIFFGKWLMDRLQLVKLFRWIWDNMKETRSNFKIVQTRDNFYVQKAIKLKNSGDFERSEECLKEAIRVNPKNGQAYALLAWFTAWENPQESVKLFEKAIALDPNDIFARSEMGWFYRMQKNIPEAIKSFQEALALDPENHWLFYNMGLCLEESGQSEEAEKAYRKALRLNPAIDRYWLALGILYEKTGKKEAAETALQKAVENYYQPQTIQNYREIVFLLKKQGIIPVCVQYPLRSLMPLKKILQDIPGIFFVDNETPFKKAIEKESYEAYFTDRFAGDFGHCTAKGNLLLAQNIAHALLEIVDDKKTFST